MKTANLALRYFVSIGLFILALLVLGVKIDLSFWRSMVGVALALVAIKLADADEDSEEEQK